MCSRQNVCNIYDIYHSRVRQKVFALPINKATETFETDCSKVCTL